MFCSIALIRRITTTITGRNVLTFITGEMLASNCSSSKSMFKSIPKEVAAEICVTVHQRSDR